MRAWESGGDRGAVVVVGIDAVHQVFAIDDRLEPGCLPVRHEMRPGANDARHRHVIEEGHGIALAPRAVDHAVPAEVRLYDRLFTTPNPGSVDDFLDDLNPNSLEIVNAVLEPALRNVAVGSAFQFERTGYFSADTVDHAADKPVFNRAVTMRDSWAKIEKEALQKSHDT